MSGLCGQILYNPVIHYNLGNMWLNIPGHTVSGQNIDVSLSGTIPIANGGTNNSSAYTAGSVIFSNGTSLTQDNSEFYWDDTNYTLGIGTIPQVASVLTARNSSGAAKPIWLQSYGTGSTVGLRGDFARGTVGSPAAAQAGDILNFLSGRGYGTSQAASTSTGVVQVVAGETFTNTSNATYLVFKTTPTGSITSVERIRINSTGNVLIDTITDNGVDALQIGSGLAANYAKFTGATSGYAQIMAAATTASYLMSLPPAQGAASSYLLNDGAGNLSWTTGTPPAVSSNIDGGSSATLYTTPQIVVGGTA